MVEAESLAAVVSGVLLALLGGIGTLVVSVGALAGVLEWTALSWLLPLAFVVGVGLVTWGTVELLTSATDLLSGDGLSGLTEKVDTYTLRNLLD
jgi:hypothetical protein